ncbi:toprim domain-containing protein [Gramella sp. AN32]|uniref:Toprim domain-containing protein n=1 Tax=Christiangramia antarctica TaxID=2058158 RepID=A0ABW5X0H7_9FLAO|nr:toprim domain-containing protein [Gramella sp. AN32]MCM4156889.1 DNA primase [Gramella sp. AN32]
MDLKTLSWSSARNVCIVKTLAKLGHYPTRTSEKEAWFLSPLRSETQASFNVSLFKNLWYDYGLGKGGNSIDLIMTIRNCSFKEAIELLSNGPFIFSFCPPPVIASKNQDNSISIVRSTSLDHPALIQYILQRGIPLQIAHTYCKEVWYRINSQEYFAIGLENHLGGWELRNKYYKNSSSPKSYSFISHSSDRLLVTEGIFDFLSLAVMKADLVKNSDCIILNSLAFLKDINDLFVKYSEVVLFLDNDAAGKKATSALLDFHNNVTDASDIYTGYTDLNEKLMSHVRKV